MRRFSFCVLFLSCLVSLTLATPQNAAAKAKKQAAKSTPKAEQGPVAHPVFERDGSFGFCLANQAYPDDRKLTIARSPKDEVNLGVTIPKAGFKPGHKYDLDLSLDSTVMKKVRTIALGPDDLLLQMGDDATFRAAFQTSQTLTLMANGNKMTFPLPPMKKVWDSLGSCLKTNKGKIDQNMKKTEEAMPEPLKALLITSGFKDIVPLSMEKIPPADRPADFVWEMNQGKVTGGVRERQAPEGKDLATLAGLHIDGLKKRCNGTFKADVGNEDKAPGLTGRLAQVSCALKEESGTTNLFVTMYFYLTEKGRFTVFSFETDEANKTLATDAGKALRTTLLDFAKQPAGK